MEALLRALFRQLDVTDSGKVSLNLLCKVLLDTSNASIDDKGDRNRSPATSILHTKHKSHNSTKSSMQRTTKNTPNLKEVSSRPSSSTALRDLLRRGIGPRRMECLEDGLKYAVARGDRDVTWGEVR